MGRTACTEPQCLYKGALYLYLYLFFPTGRTACTEPQCLHNGALYLLPPDDEVQICPKHVEADCRNRV